MKQVVLAAFLAGVATPALADANLDALVKAYPDFIAGYDAKDLILKNGKRIAIADGVATKTAEQRLDSADINDMFAATYPLGTSFPVPETVADDPGRARNTVLFDAMYGDCKKGQVKMRAVAWLPKLPGGSVQVTTANGVADALDAVSKDLQELPEKFRPFMMPSAGTFNCRTIAGTDRKSMHSYAAAIDLNVKFSDYWRFSGATKETQKVTYKNRMPTEIVAIFEKHGFIWGGKWYHYDTMHFEYRPEMLATGRAMRADGSGVEEVPSKPKTATEADKPVPAEAGASPATPAATPTPLTPAASAAPVAAVPAASSPAAATPAAPVASSPPAAATPAAPVAAVPAVSSPAAATPAEAAQEIVPLPDALPKKLKKPVKPKPGAAKGK